MMACQNLLCPIKVQGIMVILTLICISSEAFRFKPPTVLDDLRRPNASLIEKIIQIEDMACTNTCGSDFPSQWRRLFNMRKCQVCQCDATCVHYHTCCPDVVLQNNMTYNGLGSECVQLIPTDIDESFSMPPSDGLFSSLITKCYAGNNGVMPDDIPLQDPVNEVTQRFKCERPDIGNPDEALPVTDTTTNLTYRNVYCARCNHVEEKAQYAWTANISCEENADMLMHSISSKMELYQLLLSTEDVQRTACRMVFMSKDREYGRECRLPTRRIISTCNETGEWGPDFYDADIEKACLMYTSLFENRYKNMFCFLCNWYYPMSLQELLERIWVTGSNPARITFSALIDFRTDHRIEDLQEQALICSATQIFDNSTCSCRDIRCGDWENFDEENKVCRRRIESEHFGYHACFKVTVELLYVPEFSSLINLTSLARNLQVGHRIIITVSSWCPGNRTLIMHLEIWEKEPDAPGHGHSFEEAFENDGKMFCEFVQAWSKNDTESCTLDAVDRCPRHSLVSLPCESREVTPLHQVILTSDIQSSEASGEKKEITFLPYNKLDHCAYVEMSVAEFHDYEDVLIHNMSVRNISKSKVAFIQNDTMIRLCLHDYLSWAHMDMSPCLKHRVEYSNTSFDTWTPAGLISIITSCISLFFLFLTLVTYLLFEKLRTQGSKNIMVLTVTLFIAQALYEFAIEQFENQLLCSIFGVLIHYFWLASIFSMNACTVERFAKLCFPLESRSFFMTKKPFIIATLYTFLCPLVIIGCNVIANVVVKNHFGYGNPRICYINERNSRIFSFVLPMCLIVILNTTLLILTIIKLRKQSLPGDNAKASHSRIGLVACVRLSVVTGVSWLLSLLYEAVPAEAMSYVFTALLGLQGVIFFFSLLGNKTVLGYYVQFFNPKPARRSESPGTQSTSGTASKGNFYKGGEPKTN